MKKILIWIFTFFISNLYSQDLPDKIIVGYWHNWGYSPNIVYLTDIPEAYDVINISFAIPTQPFGADMRFVPDSGIYPEVDDFINEIAMLRNLGKKVLISIGGANDPISLESIEDIQVFVTSMSDIINSYGFDGIDVDLEGGSVSLDPGDNNFQEPTTPKIVNLIEAINQLTEIYPELILTAAPETAYVQGGYANYGGIWGAYLPLINGLREKWTYIHVQHYNSGSMYGSDGVVYTPSTADFHVAMADMLLAGFHVDIYGQNLFFEPLLPNQVAIGLPASPTAAGSGYTNTEAMESALNYIILGESYGGQYQLSESDGYYDFRGVMTWSINWDVDNSFEFSNFYNSYFDDLPSVNNNEFLINQPKTPFKIYPNPGIISEKSRYSQIKIEFEIDNSKVVELSIFNLKGQKIKSILRSKIERGIYVFQWDCKDYQNKFVQSGVYYYQLKTENFCENKFFTVLR